MKTMVSERGQVTIPKALRDRLGIRAGTELDFQEDRGRLVARKISPEDPVEAVYGILDLPVSVDEFISEVRGDPDAV
jgi:antitoxin PrlF